MIGGRVPDIEKIKVRDEKASYYDEGGLTTLDIIKAKLTQEQYKGFLLGSAIKYTCRMNFKGTAQRDAEKAANYMTWLAEIKE